VDLPAALDRATSDFDRLVSGISADAWAQPSPCTDWTVRAVVNHVVAGNIMAARLLEGATTADAVSGLLDVDLLGDAAEDVVRRTGADQLAAFARPGAMEMTVHHPAADLPGQVFLILRLGDVLVHGWDVARGSGQSEQLDSDAASALWEAVQPLLPLMVARGIYGEGPSGTVADDAPVQQRLLDAMGRRG
jgi:uncharacterized protein (TIGR03086 family)